MRVPESWERAKRLLEAALFASGDALSDAEAERITGLTGPAIEKAVSEINEELVPHPFYIERVEDGWIMVLKREYEEKVAHLFPQRLLSQSEMRTLALVATNEPVTISEIVRVRGSSAREHLRRLIQLGLVREVKEGKKKIYRTTKKFSLLFKVERSGGRNNEPSGD
ncbi:MAG TPA: SMC-Scp complex subunit ScpB [Candidatus Korarchaeota archaeon]|nr:SMC-Scp complex subunit ScpB [Candidatus Korarchaeota archaeon]